MPAARWRRRVRRGAQRRGQRLVIAACNPRGFMATNPLKDDPVRDARVRELAYRLWEENGRPHGRDLEFWEQARELVAIEDSPGAGLLPNPQQEPNAPRE